MNIYIIFAGLFGFIFGLGLMWILTSSRLAAVKQLLEDRSAQIDELKSRLKQHEDADYKARIAELQTLLESERRSIGEKIALLEQAEKNMTASFENLANRIIEEKSKKFTEQNKLNIGEVLNPLREQLGDFRKKIEDVYDKESKDRLSLHHEITSLKSLNEQMSKDAINLTKALKGDSKKRGTWGEVILERVLEVSGLKNGREYETQGSFRDESGKLFYPDVVVHLPDKKDVVIDSKVSLNAYERYCSAEDENERKQALNEHIASIRNHIAGLQGKNYSELVKVNSLDMVLMFVPIEPALMLALEHDENLYQDAFRKGIFLVSPSTLTMNLHIIHNMWRYEYQNRNAQQIAKSAADMYEKFVGFVEALEDVGDKLDKAQSAYRTAHNRLSDGKGNLIKRAEDMRKLGLETGKRLPGELVKKNQEENETPVLPETPTDIN
jgi:DNA recombination protein RmuC